MILHGMRASAFSSTGILRRGRRTVSPSAIPCLLAAVVVAAAGCSSDDFGPTGSGFPSDVSQDSLAIELQIVGAREEAAFELPPVAPPQGRPLNEREFLYLGRIEATGWKATPLLRYAIAFGDTVALDSLVADPGIIQSIPISFRMGREDAKRAADKVRVSIYQLNAPLDPSMVAGPVTDYLGPKIGDYEALRGQTLDFDLLEGMDAIQAMAIKQMAVDWMVAGGHNGIALVDTAVDSSLLALASSDFDAGAHEHLLAAQNSSVGQVFIFPKMTVNYKLGFDELGVTFQPESDLTVFERSSPPDSTMLSLDAHLVRRCWFDFDFSGIPRAATINSAALVLHFDRSRFTVTGFPGSEVPLDPGETDEDLLNRADGDRTFQGSTLSPVEMTAVVYEATRDEAASLDTSSLPQVLNALRSVRPDVIVSGTEEGDQQLSINISDFAQRVVNGIFGDTVPGLLVRFTDEELQFIEAGFYSSSAGDSLKPRIEIRYTPPADFVP